METKAKARLFTIRATDRGNVPAVLAGVVFTLLLMPGPAVTSDAHAAVAPSAAASSDAAQKFYVVGEPVDGQREFLFAIAAQALGDGKRYREIFDLNRGRPQPDGRVMSDPTVVEPGWILLLPDDARGPGVRTGALPSVPSPAALPSAGTPAPPAEARPQADEGGVSPSLLATLAGLLLAALAAPLLLRRTRRTPAPAGPSPKVTPKRRGRKTRTDAPPHVVGIAPAPAASTATPPTATATTELPLVTAPSTAAPAPEPPVTTRPSAVPVASTLPAPAGPDVRPPTPPRLPPADTTGTLPVTPPADTTGTPSATVPASAAPTPTTSGLSRPPLPAAPTGPTPAREPRTAAPTPAGPEPQPTATQPAPPPTTATQLAPPPTTATQLAPPPTTATQLASPQPVSPPPAAAPRPVTPLMPATPPKRVSLPIAAARPTPVPAPRQAPDDLPASAARLIPVESPERAAEPAPLGEGHAAAPEEETPAPVVTGLRRAITLPTGDLQRVAGIGSLAATAPGWFPPLVTDLDVGGTPTTVRLVGARPARWGSAYGWLEDGWRPPPSSVPIVLGEHDGRRLWVDLAAAPDVLTLGGDEDACRRLGVRLLAQLAPAVDVVVIGDVLGAEPLPERAHRLASVGELAGLEPAALRVVFCPGTSAGALWRERRSLAASGHRTVPVVIGEAPPARWSVHAMAEGSAR